MTASSTARQDDFFGFRLRGGGLHTGGAEDEALAFEVRPTKIFAFGKGGVFSQTRYRF